MGITKTSFPTTRQEFGIHSVAAVSRSTGLPYGMLAIVGDASVALEASSVDNRGGSSLFPWATEITEIDSNATFNIRSWPDWVYTVFFGAEVSTTAASATDGTVSALVNYVNTSVFDATTGIATATLKSGENANMKMNQYIVVAASATTVDVYATSNFDFTRGTNLYFTDNALKITDSPLTVVDAGASPVLIPGTGIELTGGSGTIAFVAGDVAVFEVYPPHTGLSIVNIGQTGIVFPEHKLFMYGKKRASGESVMIECFKAQAVSGGTIPMSQSDFAATDINVKLLVDETEQQVLRIHYLDQVV